MNLTIQPVINTEGIDPRYNVELDGAPVLSSTSYDWCAYNINAYQGKAGKDRHADYQFVEAVNKVLLQRGTVSVGRVTIRQLLDFAFELGALARPIVPEPAA